MSNAYYQKWNYEGGLKIRDWDGAVLCNRCNSADVHIVTDEDKYGEESTCYRCTNCYLDFVASEDKEDVKEEVMISSKLQTALLNGQEIEVTIPYHTHSKKFVATMNDSVLGYRYQVREFIDGTYSGIQGFDGIDSLLKFMEQIRPLDEWFVNELSVI